MWNNIITIIYLNTCYMYIYLHIRSVPPAIVCICTDITVTVTSFSKYQTASVSYINLPSLLPAILSISVVPSLAVMMVVVWRKWISMQGFYHLGLVSQKQFASTTYRSQNGGSYKKWLLLADCRVLQGSYMLLHALAQAGALIWLVILDVCATGPAL